MESALPYCGIMLSDLMEITGMANTAEPDIIQVELVQFPILEAMDLKDLLPEADLEEVDIV
jgi:hypothetical protein